MTAPISMGRVASPAIDHAQVDPEVLKAAQGMEAMFLDYMMKVMRQTVPKNEMNLESPATEVYRSMLDSETAQRAARGVGIGLADQIIAYLQPESYHLKEGQSPSKQEQRTALANGSSYGRYQ